MKTTTLEKRVLTRVKAKSQVTLPARLRRALAIEEGDMLEASVQHGTIVLRPKRILDRDSVEASIAEGLADLQEGRVYGPYKSMAGYAKARRTRTTS